MQAVMSTSSHAPFLPRLLIPLGLAFSVTTCIAIALFAFILPSANFRKTHPSTTCTVISSAPCSSSDCVNFTITSPPFPSPLPLLLPPSNSPPHTFPCRFSLEPPRIFTDRSTVPLSAILFLIFASVQFVLLLLVLFPYILLLFGVDLITQIPLHLIIFAPPHLLYQLYNSLCTRFPNVPTYTLSFHLHVHTSDHLIEDLLHHITPPCPYPGAIFLIPTDGYRESVLLNSIPANYHRLLLLPSPDSFPSQTPTSLSSPESIDKSSFPADPQAIHASLLELTSLFDTVYQIPSSQLSDYSHIINDVIAPHVPLRTHLIARNHRISRSVMSFLSRLACAGKSKSVHNGISDGQPEPS